MILSPGFPLLPRQLLIELGHIVVPFRLVTRASHWRPELVLFSESCHLEFATVVSRSVAENGLVTLQRLVLLVNQPDVAVKAWRERQEGRYTAGNLMETSSIFTECANLEEPRPPHLQGH